MQAFHFFTKLEQTLLLGMRARTGAELLAGIQSVPESSIYFHTHRFLHQYHFLSPEPPNDFAYWVTHVLGDDALGEQLWSVGGVAEILTRMIQLARQLGINGREHIRNNFLLTRHIKDYLLLLLSLFEAGEVVYL